MREEALANISQILQKAVHREIKISLALISFSSVSMHRITWQTVLSFDASQKACATVYNTVSLDTAHMLLRHAVLMKKPERIWIDSWQRIDPAPHLSRDVFHDKFIPGFVTTHTWKTAFTHIWRRQEYIKFLEAHFSFSALDWDISHNITDHTIWNLSDSTAAMGALTKGRSSWPGMLLPCRKFAALSISHNTYSMIIHVRTAYNPADALSRRLESTARPTWPHQLTIPVCHPNQNGLFFFSKHLFQAILL